MIIIDRSNIEDDKATLVKLKERVNGRDWFWKKDIEIVEGYCGCGATLETRQEQRFNKCTGKCFSCHGYTEFWGHKTNLKFFTSLDEFEIFKRKVLKHDQFAVFRCVFNGMRGMYQVYFGYNLAKAYCSIRHKVDIGY